VTAPQPIPDDELAAIKARAKDASADIFAGELFIIQRGAAAWLAREDVPRLVAEVETLRARAPELERGRWWRVTEPDGSIWCETSSESEARASMKKRHTLWNLHTARVEEWREVLNG
jgi:hypothetical protein